MSEVLTALQDPKPQRLYRPRYPMPGDHARYIDLNENHYGRHKHFRGVAAQERGTSWVYFMKTGDYVKVGHSKNILKRLAEIRLSNPLPVLLIGLVRGGQELETKVNRLLRDRGLHVQGEWFRAQDDILSEIEEFCDD